MPDGKYLILSHTRRLAIIKNFLRLSPETGEAQPIGLSASLDSDALSPNGWQLIYTACGKAYEDCEDWVLENFVPRAGK
jgi:hypothetical protein